MVAISLYRGNLHRVPDVPRRWLMPNPQISLKDFRVLLTRRSRALFRLRSSSSSAITTTATTTSNPNPNPNSNPTDTNSVPNQLSEAQKEEGNASRPEARLGTEKLVADCGEGPSGEDEDRKRVDFDGFSTEPVNGSVSLPGLPKPDVTERASDPVEGGANSQDVPVEKVDELPNSNSETRKKDDVMNDKQKRKVEVEEKLQILNGKKHNLVQLLKQILNAEEELKRRISMQGNAIRPYVPLQVDASNDSGSMTRHFAPRMGSEPNLNGDMEGGEADDPSNHNFHPRQMFRMNSTSPSSESPIRRPAYIQHNVVPHPSRATLGATVSPSRFAPIGHQGHPANLPTLSVSGTNYIASSPSPAASGGTSTFRDSRLPSPWN